MISASWIETRHWSTLPHLRYVAADWSQRPERIRDSVAVRPWSLPTGGGLDGRDVAYVLAKVPAAVGARDGAAVEPTDIVRSRGSDRSIYQIMFRRGTRDVPGVETAPVPSRRAELGFDNDPCLDPGI